jgi:hypothetical protein
VVKAVWYSLFALGMFGEMLFQMLSRHTGRWLWPAALLGPTLVYMVTHVDARYRYPVFALTALLCCSLTVRALRWARALAVQDPPWHLARPAAPPNRESS